MSRERTRNSGTGPASSRLSTWLLGILLAVSIALPAESASEKRIRKFEKETADYLEAGFDVPDLSDGKRSIFVPCFFLLRGQSFLIDRFKWLGNSTQRSLFVALQPLYTKIFRTEVWLDRRTQLQKAPPRIGGCTHRENLRKFKTQEFDALLYGTLDYTFDSDSHQLISESYLALPEFEKPLRLSIVRTEFLDVSNNLERLEAATKRILNLGFRQDGTWIDPSVVAIQDDPDKLLKYARRQILEAKRLVDGRAIEATTNAALVALQLADFQIEEADAGRQKLDYFAAFAYLRLGNATRARELLPVLTGTVLWKDLAVELGSFLVSNGEVVEALEILLKLDRLSPPPTEAKLWLGQIALVREDKRYEGRIDWPRQAQNLSSSDRYFTEYLTAENGCGLVDTQSVLQRVLVSSNPVAHIQWIKEAHSQCRNRIPAGNREDPAVLVDVARMLSELELAPAALELLDGAVQQGISANNKDENIAAGNIYFMRSIIRTRSSGQIDVTPEILELSLADTEKALVYFAEADPGPDFLPRQRALLKAMEDAFLLADLDKADRFDRQFRSLPRFQLPFELRDVDRSKRNLGELYRELHTARERFGLNVVRGSFQILSQILNPENSIADLKEKQFNAFLLGLDDARDIKQFQPGYWDWHTVLQELSDNHQTCLADRSNGECWRFRAALDFTNAVDCFFSDRDDCVKDVDSIF